MGLDLQSNHWHLIQLSQHQRKIDIRKKLALAINPGTIAEGKVIDWIAFANQLNAWVAQHEIYRVPLAVSIPAHSIKMGELQLPKSNHQEIRDEIENDLKKIWSFKEPLAIDYHVMSKTKHELQTCYAATESTYIRLLQLNLLLAGLAVKCIDTDMHALKRTAAYLKLSCESLLYYDGAQLFFSIFNANGKIILQACWQDHEWQATLGNLLRSHALRMVCCFVPAILFARIKQHIHDCQLIAMHVLCEEKLEIPSDYALAFGLALSLVK